MTSKVTADKNPKYSTSPGTDTQDQVFLLSVPEVEKYFASDDERRCEPTAYANALAQGVTKGWRWLRSPGSISRFAACVTNDGARLARRMGGLVYLQYINACGYIVRSLRICGRLSTR